jgi:hypothetical protein
MNNLIRESLKYGPRIGRHHDHVLELEVVPRGVVYQRDDGAWIRHPNQIIRHKYFGQPCGGYQCGGEPWCEDCDEEYYNMIEDQWRSYYSDLGPLL